MLQLLLLNLCLAAFGCITCWQGAPMLIPFVPILWILRHHAVKRLGMGCFSRCFVATYLELGTYAVMFNQDNILMGPESRAIPLLEPLSIGIHLSLATALLSTCLRMPKRRQTEEFTLKAPGAWAILTVIIYASVLFISWNLNLGIMGGQEVALPYKLSGILTTARIITPGLSFIIFIPLWKKSKVIFLSTYGTLIALLLIDSVIMRSKGLIIALFAPYLIYWIFFQKKHSISYALTSAAIAYSLMQAFSLFGWIRQSDFSLAELLSEKRVIKLWKEDTEEHNSLANILMRTNLSQIHLSNFYFHEDARLGPAYGKISQWESAARYNTLAIEQFPPNAPTSSGASGLSGWYLYLGAGGVLLGAGIILALVYAVDSSTYLSAIPALKITATLMATQLLLINDTADILLRPSFLNFFSAFTLFGICLFPRRLTGALYKKESRN